MGRTRATRATLGLAAVVLLITGCGGPVAAEDLEASIVQQAEGRGWTLESVDCPEDLPADVGATVVCAVQIPVEVEARPGEVGVVDRFRVVVRGIDRGTPRFSMFPLLEGEAS